MAGLLSSTSVPVSNISSQPYLCFLTTLRARNNFKGKNLFQKRSYSFYFAAFIMEKDGEDPIVLTPPFWRLEYGFYLLVDVFLFFLDFTGFMEISLILGSEFYY
ncbi:hypothetical protein EO93_17830 [Methanosarcina sp. 1.H.A.2.2]|nr:hypothetical protein EO93_17830 [Methanosarcina sp. 1.H.A.2.2]